MRLPPTYLRKIDIARNVPAIYHEKHGKKDLKTEREVKTID